ncbi:MAG TPA: polysaccharide biosynthesis tyrosine autokinase [Micromonosporaceae bacterium]|nr:polysaccharide biosynthesis tyrosine autokinase [Micromonosporaceae bacterium]
MELSSLLPLLRERWKSIVAVALVALAAGAVLTVRQTPMYEARTTLFVSTWTDVGDPQKAYQADLLSKQKVKSYTVIMHDTRLMRSVIERLDLNISPQALAGQVTTEAVEDTVLLAVRVSDPSPVRAQQIATAVGDEFIELIPVLENAPDGQQAAVRVSVVSPPELPTSPVSPQPTRNLALALAIGLLAGFALAAARHSLDTTIRTSEQLEEVTGAAPLGVVPFDSGSAKNPVVAPGKSNGPRTEAYRHVQANMQFMDADRETRLVVVTSAVSMEGKSTTACNLARSLGEQGKRVLLIDGDLRRPQAARYLGLPSGAGLTSVLVGRAGLDEVIQSWGDGAFSVLASGPVPPNPSKLIGSRHMRQVLVELRERYDIVLIDAPPVLPVVDAVVLAANSDGAILVVRHGKTRRDQLTKAVTALQRADADVLGTVLNMAPRRGRDSYYYDYGYTPGSDAADPPVDAAAGRLSNIRHKMAVRS